MSSFNTYKQKVVRSSVMKPFQYELDRVPRQFSDYMNEQCNRFSEICKVYLEGMTIDDVRYMKPEDFINLVPDEQYRHKLLMTVMVRRYLYRPEDLEDTIYCKPPQCDTFSDAESTFIDASRTDASRTDASRSTSSCDRTEYTCNKCDHICDGYKKNAHGCTNTIHGSYL